MPRRDLIRILIIGAGVGLLIQPILANNLPANDLSHLTLPWRIVIFLFFLIIAPLALWIAKLLSRWLAGLYQFAQFAAVGTLNSFIYAAVLNVETFLYGSVVISNVRFAVFVAIAFLFQRPIVSSGTNIGPSRPGKRRMQERSAVSISLH